MENIGVFDSGIGGANVIKEIIKILPNENYIYYSDSANNPYGDKTDKEIIEICDKIVNTLIAKQCKAIVIACNTASAKAVDYLREKYTHIPIVAIEPAYKMVHDQAVDGTTLIMATKGTIESERFKLLYNKYNNHKTTIIECVGLADVIENGTENEIDEYLQKNLSQYNGKIENVVLGCTHYPIIQDKIIKTLGNVKIFNGAPYLAKHLKDVLKEKNLLSQRNKTGEVIFIDSSNSEKKKKRFYSYINA